MFSFIFAKLSINRYNYSTKVVNIFFIVTLSHKSKLKNYFFKESLFYLTEIISRFDLVAVQEVSANMAGLEKLMKLLCPNWNRIATDSTDGELFRCPTIYRFG
jgi:hypothetical protein